MCTGNTQTVKCADGMCLACFDCCCCDGWTDLHGVYAWFTRLLEKPNRHMDDQDRCLLPCNLGSASPTHYSRYGSRFFYFCCRTKNQAELVLTRGKKEKKKEKRGKEKKSEQASMNPFLPSSRTTYNEPIPRMNHSLLFLEIFLVALCYEALLILRPYFHAP